MSAITLALVIFGIMLLLMAVRIPIAVSMFVAGATGYVMQTGWGPFSSFINTQAFARFASYDLSVIPALHPDGTFRHAGRHQPGALPLRGCNHGRLSGRPCDGIGFGVCGFWCNLRFFSRDRRHDHQCGTA